MNCPYCNFAIKTLVMNATALPDVAPLVCEGCAEVSLVIDRRLYRTTHEQLAALKQSPAWRDMIAPAQRIIRQNLDAATAIRRDVNDALEEGRVNTAAQRTKELAGEVPPVDRTKITLTDGSPVRPDHREIDPRTGQQKAYVVLSAEERAKGFVRPVRRTYRHVGR